MFVNFFRSAAPFIEGHRGKTFVLSVGSQVMENDAMLFGLLEDVLVLSGLGVKIVIVYGSGNVVDKKLKGRAIGTRTVGDFRVTNSKAMEVVMEVAGMMQLKIEAKLSRGPSVSVVRKHTRDSNNVHFAPPASVVSGNYTIAKRMGVVDGVDFGRTGEVRFVQADQILNQLAAGNIVVMSNIGFSSVGEVLNCNHHDVAAKAAIQIRADKLICLTGKSSIIRREDLGEWMAVPDAETRLMELTQYRSGQGGAASSSNEAGQEHHSTEIHAAGSAALKSIRPSATRTRFAANDDQNDPSYLALNLVSCIAVCKNGVKRAHLVDCNIDGALLLELYSRDGVGTMISADFYEGIRAATQQDVEGISALLQPLMDTGVVLQRTQGELLEEIPNFTIVEREARVIACVLLKDLGVNSQGQSCVELAAFCVDPQYRSGGRGDSLLDYVEQKARARSFDMLVLLTTRTADWFCCRGFGSEGLGSQSKVLPEARRSKIDPARRAKCYSKILEAIPESGMAPAGKRIGF